MKQLYKDKEYKRIIMEEWDKVRLPIKQYLDKTGKSIKFTCDDEAAAFFSRKYWN